ncbi:MAG: hypothetical protein JST68_04770 [Bacteroidetes bacterium]|nr:hypothetical protein [Bacteroidota bacterium]
MLNDPFTKYLVAASAAFLAIHEVPAQGTKEAYIPAKVYRVPEGNDYNNNESEYSNQRKVETENIIVFWSKEFGADPTTNPDATKRFTINEAMKECERFYNFYVNDLKFVEKGHSVTDKYKVLFYVIGGKGGTAFGGGTENKIGNLWTPAARMNKAPYGALAHELGHSFQYLVHADGGWGYTSAPQGSRGQTIHEMTSQYMLWQVYPEWMTFENYHLKAFMKLTHLAFLHEDNQYHSPYVLEYWSEKHGIDFIGKLWRQAIKGEDPVMTYKRLTGIDQAAFNDEIFDAARKFITWDMPRIRDVAAPYANQHSSNLHSVGDGWYQIADSNCPQNYGYNGIKLKAPSAGAKVKLSFKGVAGAEGFRKINTEKAGWRYGFVAVKEDGTRVYSKTFSKDKGTAKFTVPEKTAYLWLVVSGAPKEHWEHLSDGKPDNDEQWPYQIKLTGTSLDDSQIK